MLKTLLTLLISLVSFTSIAQDARTRTFPLNKPFPDRAFLCLNKEAAIEIVESQAKNGTEATEEVAEKHVLAKTCGIGRAMMTYLKRVHQAIDKDGEKWNVYEAKSGQLTFYVLTTWNHIEISV